MEEKQQINSEIINLSIISNKINNKMDITFNNEQHNNKMKLINFLLFEENKSLKAIEYNANLFYHSWLFSDKEMENYNGNFVKNPYIGLFHPYGSIHAITKNNILNTFNKTSQNIHDPIHYSPDNSHIFIDNHKIGKAYSVCIDDEIIRGTNTIKNNKVRIRVELIICIQKSSDIKINENDYNKLPVHELFCKLSEIEDLFPLFDTFEVKHLKLPIFNNKVSDILTKEKTYYQPDSLVLFRYREHKAYQYLLNVNIPIESINIPYYDEINAKLPSEIKRYGKENINYEFGLIIARHID
jgi:hypothetical protein